jgi:hypothetical protein
MSYVPGTYVYPGTMHTESIPDIHDHKHRQATNHKNLSRNTSTIANNNIGSRGPLKHHIDDYTQ